MTLTESVKQAERIQREFDEVTQRVTDAVNQMKLQPSDMEELTGYINSFFLRGLE